MADALELSDEFERPPVDGEMQQIVIQQHAAQQQMANHETNLELVMELIEHDPQVQQNKEEIKELAQRFDEELNGAADPDVLRQFLGDAKDYSVSVAAQMAILALHMGATGVLDLE